MIELDGVDVVDFDVLVDEIVLINEEFIIVGEVVYKYKDKLENIKNIKIFLLVNNVFNVGSLCFLVLNKYNKNIDVYICYMINFMYIRKF